MDKNITINVTINARTNTTRKARIDRMSYILGRRIDSEMLRVIDAKFPDLEQDVMGLPEEVAQCFAHGVNEYIDAYFYGDSDEQRYRDYERERACAYTHNPYHHNINARLRYEYCDHEETCDDHDAMIDYFCHAIFD